MLITGIKCSPVQKKNILKRKICTFNRVFADCNKGSEFPCYSLQANVTLCSHNVKVSAGIIFFA